MKYIRRNINIVIILILLISFIPVPSVASVVYTGSHWDTSVSGNSEPYGITMNTSYFWIVDKVDSKVYQYYHNGTFTGTSWSIQSFSNGITMNASYFWTTDISSKTYQYYNNGTYTNTSWDITDFAEDIVMNTSYFWVINSDNDKVYQYYHNGTPTGTEWQSVATNLAGITMNNSYMWITSNTYDEVYRYYHNGTNTGIHWDTAGNGNNDPRGIIQNDTYFWVIDNEDAEVYQYYINTIPITSSLKTESQTNPTQVATNTSTPHFSWTYTDPNETQSTYEIYVGTTVGNSDMWNSQISSSSAHTTYAGTTLEEVTTYYIQVRTNDGYENSDWVTGTFALKDTTTYSPPSTGGGISPLDIYSEKISTPVVITETITDTFSETDSLTFILYLIGALLGALIFGIVSNKENLLNVVLTGTVGWVVTLVSVVINNLLEIIVINSIITMILSVLFGFVVYAIYDQYAEENSKSKLKRRPKK